MPIKMDLSGLEKALKSIGGKKAEIGSLRSATRISNPIELKIIKGGSVVLTGDDIKHVQSPTGLLTIGNTQITLHIYEPSPRNADIETLSAKPAENPKFHVAECETIEKMRNIGRFDGKYVPSMNQDGLFAVRPLDQATNERTDEIMAQLMPCKNCLKLISYGGYLNHGGELEKRIVSSFSIKRFFEDFKSVFRCLPLYTPETFPEGNYTKDWARISYKTRRDANWTCSCCNVFCAEETGLLHVHHKDGTRGNNRPSNLEVLCVACHKSRHLHGRMYYSPHNKLKLEQLRISQKLPRLCDSCNL